MKTYTGQQYSPAGLYYNLSTMELCTISGRLGGYLEGDEDMDVYVKLNPVLWLLMAPLLGAAMVMFLPCVGFGVLGYQIVKKLLFSFSKIKSKIFYVTP